MTLKVMSFHESHNVLKKFQMQVSNHKNTFNIFKSAIKTPAITEIVEFKTDDDYSISYKLLDREFVYELGFVVENSNLSASILLYEVVSDLNNDLTKREIFNFRVKPNGEVLQHEIDDGGCTDPLNLREDIHAISLFNHYLLNSLM